MYKATVKQMLSKADQENLEEKIKGGNKRILRISFSLDLTPYPLWKLCLATPLTQIAVLKLISLKTSYFCIKQLGRGI